MTVSTVHVLPLGDLAAHDVPGGWDGHDPADRSAGAWRVLQVAEADEGDDECRHCRPSVEHVPNPHGPDGWVVTHHALDGREHLEGVG